MTSTITKKWVSVRNTEGKHQHIAHWDTIIFNGNRSLIRSWLFVLTSVHIYDRPVYTGNTWNHIDFWAILKKFYVHHMLCYGHQLSLLLIHSLIVQVNNIDYPPQYEPSQLFWLFSSVDYISVATFARCVCVCVCAYTLVTTMATHWPSVWTASYPRVNFAFTFSMTTTQTQTGHCHMAHCVCVSVCVRAAKQIGLANSHVCKPL